MLTPINQQEQDAYNGFVRFFGVVNGMKMFRFWHRWLVKD